MAGDRAFLLDVYASTRADEVAALPWDDAAKAAFLRMQAEAQDADYRGRPEVVFLVVTYGGRDVGRLYRADLPGELRIVDVALLPGSRGLGIGRALLRDLVAEADERGTSLTLHVEHWNRARRLYERLGFVEVARDDVYVLMERKPVS